MVEKKDEESIKDVEIYSLILDFVIDKILKKCF